MINVSLCVLTAYTWRNCSEIHNKQSPQAKRWVTGKPSEYSDDSRCERNRKHPDLSSSLTSFHLIVPPSFFSSSPHQSVLSLSLCSSAVLLGILRFGVDFWLGDSPSLVFPDCSDITRSFASLDTKLEPGLPVFGPVTLNSPPHVWSSVLLCWFTTVC